MDICIDFDGTCVSHEFPKVGKDIGAAPILKELIANGHNLILFTMRSNCTDNKGASACVPEIHNGTFLDDAVNWFNKNEIPLHGINVNPQQTEWTSSPKAYGQLYIDDAALGCPLKREDGEKRPFVDWEEVRKLLVDRHLIKQTAEEMMIQQQVEHLENIINYCRQKERQVKGFGHASLDTIATEQKMTPEIKSSIKDLIDNPEKKFKAGFKKA